MRILSHFQAANIYGILDADAFDDWSNEPFFECPLLYSCVDLWQFSTRACFKTMAMTITKIPATLFSHSSNTIS
jgi:hypothetical protein